MASTGATAIVVIGDVMTDVIVRPGGPLVRGADRHAAIRLAPGGSAANLAAWLAFAGRQAIFLGRVGRDDHGRQTALFRSANVTAMLGADPQAPTGVLVSLIAPDGERSFFTDRGANDRLERADLPDACLEHAALVHLSGYSLLRPAPRAAVLDFLAEAHRRGVPVSVDPGSTTVLDGVGADRFLEWTAACRFCFPNAEEAALLAGTRDQERQIEALCGRYDTVVVKRGASGASAARAHGAERCSVPAPAVEVVDTIGAGDAFLAGFLSAWLGGADLVQSTGQGCALGALATTNVGGRPPARGAPPRAHPEEEKPPESACKAH
jgi:sugar/nucleoside kinase (ribokinase family)